MLNTHIAETEIFNVTFFTWICFSINIETISQHYQLHRCAFWQNPTSQESFHTSVHGSFDKALSPLIEIMKNRL